MLAIISKILLGIFLLATPFLLYGFGVETFQNLSKISLRDGRWLAFLIGAGSFFPTLWLARTLFPSVWSYLETLEHEMTHLIVGLFFLKFPTGLRVSAHEGGEVRQIGFGTTGLTWVALAPYFFPTVSIFVVIIGYFLNLGSQILLGVLGWTTAFHLVSNWGETSFRQTDLKKVGFLKTILILPVMNLIFYGAVFAFVAGGAKGFGSFWLEGFRQTYGLFKDLWRFL